MKNPSKPFPIKTKIPEGYIEEQINKESARENEQMLKTIKRSEEVHDRG